MPTKAPNFVLAQAYALRAQLDAMIVMLEMDVPSEPVRTGCQHPEEKRLDGGTMGGAGSQILCGDCGADITELV